MRYVHYALEYNNFLTTWLSQAFDGCKIYYYEIFIKKSILFFEPVRPYLTSKFAKMKYGYKESIDKVAKKTYKVINQKKEKRSFDFLYKVQMFSAFSFFGANLLLAVLANLKAKSRRNGSKKQ